MAKLAGGKGRLLRDFEAAQAGDCADRLRADEISRREGAVTLSGRNGNAANAGMGEGAANEGDVLHSGQPDIGDELAATAQEAYVLLSDDASSDALVGRARFSHRRNLASNRASAFFIRSETSYQDWAWRPKLGKVQSSRSCVSNTRNAKRICGRQSLARLKLDAGRGQERARSRALLFGDRQPLGKLTSGRTRGVDAHFGHREMFRVRGRVENGALRSRDEHNVLLRAHARGERPHDVVDVEDIDVIVHDDDEFRVLL